jgi:hypothetical protein
MYVDSSTKEIDTAQFKKPNTPRPVQFFFEFQTKGVANVRATEAFKVRVSDQVKASGLFGSLSDEPVAGSASLSIVVNNVPLTDDTFAKGFAAGFTFGLVGSTVSDGYVCTVRYRGDMRAAPVIKLARHAIHATVGATSAPNNAVKAANPDEAVTLMLRQIVSNVLNDLSQDSAFHSPRDMAPTAAH